MPKQPIFIGDSAQFTHMTEVREECYGKPDLRVLRAHRIVNRLMKRSLMRLVSQKNRV